MEHKFHFTPPFLDAFKETVDKLSDNLKELNTVKGSDSYGICNCSYRMRYLTPKDVSTYIDYVHKGMQNNLIGSNAYDIEMFAVEAVKRFMQEHGCTPFDDASIMGNNYAGDERPTLQDLLVAHTNEVYNKVVCTPYELKQRYDNLKSDIKVFNDMHFPANMKKIIDQFPTIIKSMDGGEIYEHQPIVGKMFRAMVEEFIIFATTINMVTAASMVDYCKPVSLFKSDESIPVNLDNGESITEQVDTTKNSAVYFVFAEGKTRFISNAIKKATNSPFSHISIAFDSKLNPMYSFGGAIEEGTYVSDKGGARREDINDKYYDDIDVTVYGAYFPNEKIDEMKRIASDYVTNADKTTFDYGILLKKLMLKDGSLPKDEYRQVCSTFVNHLFKSVDVNVTDKNIPSPAELKGEYDAKKDQFHQLYSGKAHDVKPESLEKKIEKFATTRKSKPITEYVTECAILKTNEIMNAHQLPFNFNIRNIVLADSSDSFDDVLSSIQFMLNDSRSPIHELLVKFATIKRGEYVDISMIKQGFITHHPCVDKCDELRTGFQRHEAQWLDKIVYGSPFMDSNYRSDTPGNMHYHPIDFDISTLYRMFSCHHNDNEHLANNIVKVANVMRGLIENYRYTHYTIRDTLCDILAVFGEILTKDMLLLYHNNNLVVVYSDDMNNTMIPGYMYCESFVMEADNDNNNNSQNPSIENKGKLNDGTTGQKAKLTVKKLLSDFGRYISQTLAKIAPKFFDAHKAEIKWVDSHKGMNDEIKNAADNGTFKIQVNNYPGFKVPAGEIISEVKKNADALKQHLNTVDDLNKYINDKNSGGVEGIAKSLLYKPVVDANVQINNDKDIEEKTRNYVCYSNANGPQNTQAQQMLTGDMWDDIVGIVSNDGVFKALTEVCKTNNTALKDITDALSKLANAPESKPEQNNDNNNQQPQQNKDSEIQNLFNIVNRIQKNCWNATSKVLMQDVYGKTYNLYRSIVMEYERQKTVGTQNEENNGENAESTENNNNNG